MVDKENNYRMDGSRQTKDSDRLAKYENTVPALDQSLRLLLFLKSNSGRRLSLTEICKAIGIAKSKGLSLLCVLQKYGFVERDPDSKTYCLGAGLIPLSRAVLDNLDFRATAVSFIEELARETATTIFFGLLKARQIFVVYKYEGGERFRVTPGIGHTFQILDAAHGRAVVAYLPAEEQEAILKFEEKHRVSWPPVTNVAAMRKELELVRARGYAVDIGQFSPGINGIASPVFGPNNSVVGVVCLIKPFPESAIEEYGQKVRATAMKISAKLGH
jgi:DNA-binding IclR family transcriptional regulator